MLNFRNTTVAFAVVLILLITTNVGWGWYLLLLVVYLSILFYGSYSIHSQFFVKTICSGSTNEKKIAITFDDGPQQQFTPQILELLLKYNVKATFFCIGKNAASHPLLLKQIYEQGHHIGSHSYAHGFWFDLLTARQMQADLQQVHELFQKELSVNIKWFRPPYGVTTPPMKKALQQMNYTAIGWSARSLDTMIQEEERLFLRLKRFLKPGAIFLFHDSSAITVQVLPRFLEYVQEQGFEVVPLFNLINLQPYAD